MFLYCRKERGRIRVGAVVLALCSMTVFSVGCIGRAGPPPVVICTFEITPEFLPRPEGKPAEFRLRQCAVEEYGHNDADHKVVYVFDGHFSEDLGCRGSVRSNIVGVVAVDEQKKEFTFELIVVDIFPLEIKGRGQVPTEVVQDGLRLESTCFSARASKTQMALELPTHWIPREYESLADRHMQVSAGSIILNLPPLKDVREDMIVQDVLLRYRIRLTDNGTMEYIPDLPIPIGVAAGR